MFPVILALVLCDEGYYKIASYRKKLPPQFDCMTCLGMLQTQDCITAVKSLLAGKLCLEMLQTHDCITAVKSLLAGKLCLGMLQNYDCITAVKPFLAGKLCQVKT